MLRFLHNLNGSIVIKVLLVLIGISFIGWGFGGGLDNQFSGYVAKVNGQKITTPLFQQELDLKLSQIRRKMGDQYSEDIMASFNLPEKLLRDKIRDILLLQFAGENNIHVSNTELAQHIANIDAFKDQVTQKFDKTQYKIALQNAGYTLPQFEAGLRTELLVNRISDIFTGLQFVNPTEIERTASMFSETRNVRILRVTKDDVAKPAKPTDEDLKVIYEDMISNFITPERRTIEVLLFDAAELEPTINVTKDEIDAYYKEHRAEFGEPEGRHVRHILVKDEATAQKVKAALEKGKSFKDVAKEFSKDPVTAAKGGDLGTIYRGDMLPAFDEVAFAIEKGKISDPVKTPFGYHVLEVVEVQSGREKTVAEATADIKKRLVTERALDKMYDALDNADADLAGSATLQDVQKEYGGKLTTFTNVDPEGNTEDGTTIKLPNLATVLDKAFTVDEGVPSTVIDLNNTQKAFINVSAIAAPRQLTFAEVRDQLVEIYNRESIERAVLAKATQLLAQRQKGASFETLAKENKLAAPIQTIVGISLMEPSKNQMLTSAIQTQIATLKAGELLPQVYPTKLGAALYEVTAVEAGKPDPRLNEQVQHTLTSVMANDLYAQFQQALHDDANIDINDEQFANVKKNLLRN